MDTGIGRGMLEIASGIMALALIALLLKNPASTAQVVQSASQSFGNLIGIVLNSSSAGVGRG